MPRVAKGHIKQLPSGSFRVSAYAGIDPLTRRAIRFKSTAKTEQQARIELGRLLKDASEGRRPESGAAVATLMGHMCADRDLPGRGPGRADHGRSGAARGCVPVLQRPGACPAVEPGRGYPPDSECCSRRCGRGGVGHQGRAALHRKPVPHRRLDLRNTAVRLGHSGSGATTLRHYADPVREVDRRAAAYLAQLTARSAPLSPQP